MSMPPSLLPSLHAYTRQELRDLFASWGFAQVHAAKLWSLLYWSCAATWEELESLPAKVVDKLRQTHRFSQSPVVREAFSSDGHTRKFLLDMGAGQAVETVLMRFTGRATACISSQVGCAMGCVFCATGQMGFRRHLSADQIVAQVLHVQRLLRAGGVHKALGESGEATPEECRLRNVVLMGMGEPLHNYDEVMRAVDILRDPAGIALAGSRITLSTVGVVPGIRRLADERRPVHLAVSLHGATQEEREALVPVAKRWPLPELIDACRHYTESLGRRIFFEWTLIDGVNDSPAHAEAVGALIQGMPAQVNLIPLNPTQGFGGTPTRSENARAFQRVLQDRFGIPSTVRQRRGLDIGAGCGQLATGE